MQECPKQLGKIVNFAGLSGECAKAETKTLHRQAPDIFLRL